MGLKLPTFKVAGTPHEMGYQYGNQFRDMIHAFSEDRITAAETYLEERGFDGIAPLFGAGSACFERVRTFDPAGHAEHLGIAEGANIDPVQLFTTANMTDVRDILILPDDVETIEDEGCTAALVPPAMTREGASLQGQTWDLNGPDVDYVIALHRVPDDGPETWTVTCAGCQTLMGMNEHGIAVGTTNLKTKGARIGIPYLSVLHLALNQKTLGFCSAVLERAPVAGSHSYWAGDKERAVEWERTPTRADCRTTEDGPIVRTNHCLIDANVLLETDLSPSTHQRYKRMKTILDQSNDHTIDSFKQSFADRSDGRLSINRYLEDQSGAATNAAIVCDPANLKFWACRGQADKGEWKLLEFED